MNTPLISGFTFVKNGLSLGYPIKESIESLSDLCDEIVVSVGFSNKELTDDDGTYEYLTSLFSSSKYRFIKTFWDPSCDKRGEVLALQTNTALHQCRGKYCQYIQADEVLHEKDLPSIRQGVDQMENNPQIEGLVYNYIHFYGNSRIEKHTRSIYRREVRLIKHNSSITSWRDAQGFRNSDGTKLVCRQIPATIYHYGWARLEHVMSNKIHQMNKLYHGKEYLSAPFVYERIWGLKPFTKDHPRVMKDWIDKNHNDLDITKLKLKIKWRDMGLIISDFIEKITGYRIGEYKNFKLLGTWPLKD